MSPRARGRAPRLLGAIVGAAALFFAVAAPAAALPGTSATPVAAGPNPQVELHSYCAEPGEAGHLADGTTVHCSALSNSDAFAWSYYSEPVAMDPNTRDPNCQTAGCEDQGGTAPGEQRCGVQCTVPPAPGAIEPHTAPRA
ncbi:hypothetical protein NLM24_00410 [Nocardia zapadnayensis]|uniref:hypothetical protein n=1 Tax=Nocardia rhamnosiphila TaxID=426716 RepID=UPI0022453359|nr:hypothetical protein [Nocardia zapadnayensis]MCX0269201.1 hypothetical protein [Nocardia zapadnayensis]